jgi:hypothetical protein
MYGRLPSFVFGFHGCDKSVCESIVKGDTQCLVHSTNDYDWLGNGIYFWENDPQRALEFAQFLKDNPSRNHQNIKKPAVIGAAIDLGYCLNLMESASLFRLKESYDFLSDKFKAINRKMPTNTTGAKGNIDLLIRKLERLVIQNIHEFLKESNMTPYDTVRGLFFEGEDLYPTAGFKEKNHIQICVINPNCIKAYFLPRSRNEAYPRLPE